MAIVRISKIELNNFKNVSHGLIVMPLPFHKKTVFSQVEILGIYGQNGSGKTAVIDALHFVQILLTGRELTDDARNYIGSFSSETEIIVDFNIFDDDALYETTYKVVLEKDMKKKIISREIISFSSNRDGKRTNKKTYLDYKYGTANFVPRKRLEEVVRNKVGNDTDLIVAQRMAEKQNCSYIFGEDSRMIFFQKFSTDFQDCSDVIRALFTFAIKDLFIIRNEHSGMITANILLPVSFRITHEDKGLKGDFPIHLKKPTVVDIERKNILRTLIEQINTVLCTIIPGMKIGIKDYGEQMMDDGTPGYKIELISMREGLDPIPIRMESEGIIKIISILNVLILAFSNPSVCLAVDELDAGIFEYMFGELLDMFEESGKGQLIFTSHNLRPLEMLDKDSILFSTANPDNRYIRAKRINATNNLRDVYLRIITLGGQEELIYEKTDSIKMARAFRKAGRNIEKY